VPDPRASSSPTFSRGKRLERGKVVLSTMAKPTTRAAAVPDKSQLYDALETLEATVEEWETICWALEVNEADIAADTEPARIRLLVDIAIKSDRAWRLEDRIRAVIKARERKPQQPNLYALPGAPAAKTAAS
jgi:hypothetical protein